MPIGSLQSLSNLYKTALTENPNARLRVKNENGRAVFYFSTKAPGLRERIFGAQATKARAALREALGDVAEEYSAADKEARINIMSMGIGLLRSVRKSGYKHALRPDEISRILSPINQPEFRSRVEGVMTETIAHGREDLLSTLKNMAKGDHAKIPSGKLWDVLKNWPSAFLDPEFLADQHAWCLREIICSGALLAKVESLAEHANVDASQDDLEEIASSLAPPATPRGVIEGGFDFLGDYEEPKENEVGGVSLKPSKDEVRRAAFVDLNSQQNCSELQKALVSCFSRYVVGDLPLNAPNKPMLWFLCSEFKKAIEKDSDNAIVYQGLKKAIELGIEESGVCADLVETRNLTDENFGVRSDVVAAYRENEPGADWRYLFHLTKAYWEKSVDSGCVLAGQIHHAMKAAKEQGIDDA